LSKETSKSKKPKRLYSPLTLVKAIKAAARDTGVTEDATVTDLLNAIKDDYFDNH
jgi:hypothetical protein